jgi:hypothetical protein
MTIEGLAHHVHKLGTCTRQSFFRGTTSRQPNRLTVVFRAVVFFVLQPI